MPKNEVVPSEILNSSSLLSIQGAAALLKVHPNTIRNLINRGDLPAIRCGARLIRVRIEDLAAAFTPFVPGEFGIWQGQVGVLS
jgi:excisionase family DNA binding protein